MMVYSSGSTGQALLQNHSLSGGITINPAMILPASESARILAEIGNPPAGGENAKTGHKWVTDALMKYGLVKDGPLVNAIWYSEPDGAAHKYGIGSAEARAALRVVDEQFGRILDSLKSRKLDLHTNILISTDHGFVTYAGKQSLPMFLVREGLKKDSSSLDVVVSEGAIYVKDHNKEKIAAIVSLLQKQNFVGPIFTKGTTALKGWVPGTLSFESIHWNHKDRTADILVASNWDDEKNAAGYAGRSFSAGVAGHGGLSPYEVHIPLMASGPSFKRAYVDSLPTSNVDLVPTVLQLHKLPVPAIMDGRVMSELMNSAPTKQPVARKENEKVISSDGKYVLELHRTILGKYSYVDFAKITRL
jgi:arylsulfatase A-like enzyme